MIFSTITKNWGKILFIFVVLFNLTSCVPSSTSKIPDRLNQNPYYDNIVANKALGYYEPSALGKMKCEVYKGFPVKVLHREDSWVFIEDFEKERYWMQVNTLSGEKSQTVIVNVANIDALEIKERKLSELLNESFETIRINSKTSPARVTYGTCLQILKNFGNSSLATPLNIEDSNIYILIENKGVWPLTKELASS